MGRQETKSKGSLWNRICEGLRDIAGSGVLQYCITAISVLSLLMDPLLFVLDDTFSSFNCSRNSTIGL